MSDGGGWDLVMPFLPVTSRGGPFDDEAFTAGWQAGVVDRSLEVLAVLDGRALSFLVDSRLGDQMRLLGMKHGYPAVTLEPLDGCPEWVRVTFRASTGAGESP